MTYLNGREFWRHVNWDMMYGHVSTKTERDAIHQSPWSSYEFGSVSGTALSCDIRGTKHPSLDRNHSSCDVDSSGDREAVMRRRRLRCMTDRIPDRRRAGNDVATGPIHERLLIGRQRKSTHRR